MSPSSDSNRERSAFYSRRSAHIYTRSRTCGSASTDPYMERRLHRDRRIVNQRTRFNHRGGYLKKKKNFVFYYALSNPLIYLYSFFLFLLLSSGFIDFFLSFFSLPSRARRPGYYLKKKLGQRGCGARIFL